jgi:DNA gyrase/topoisomerase IV subunit A
MSAISISGLACVHNMGSTKISALGGVRMNTTQEAEEPRSSRVTQLEEELELEREYSDQLEDQLEELKEELGDERRRSNNLSERLLQTRQYHGQHYIRRLSLQVTHHVLRHHIPTISPKSWDISGDVMKSPLVPNTSLFM